MEQVPDLCLPTVLIGLPHDYGSRVTVEHGRNNPTVEEAEPVVVLGTRSECRHRAVTFPITPEMESIGIGVSTPKAGEVRIEGLLDAQMGLGWRHFDFPKLSATRQTGYAQGIAGDDRLVSGPLG
jgi:hypothetical protein